MEARNTKFVLLVAVFLAIASTTQAQHFGISNASNQAKISISDNLLISGETILDHERSSNEIITTQMEAYQWPMQGFITFKASAINMENMKLTTFDDQGQPVTVMSKSSGMKMTIDVASLGNGSYYLLMEDPINQRIAKFKFQKRG